MAKSRSSHTSGQRDYLNQSLASLLHYPIRPMPVLLPLPQPQYQEVLPYAGDRRTFTPSLAADPPQGVRRSSGRVVAGGNLSSTRFAEPQLLGICARRAIRREVLHALKRTKRGAGGKKHYNFWSKVSCK